ncbi:replication initiation protein RepC [Labrys okinawensis]|uniref:Replication initiation protein RepC n=1 Tax=Labrys okinawensis TaxID=346911 RepID=A0A2S9Q8Y6_9HYPH|nr:plasmid replication protein RepC [Labrys okinawensis]PRH85807.1 replication initiation protein RepC [Labrys okinawensis]
MQIHHATSPFGRRTLTLAQIASQAIAKTRPTTRALPKWEIYQALCTARMRLGISERALAVLNALLTFHPETTLSGEAIIVFPSNEQLSRRAHGMPASTLRRHLAVLVDAGLIIRRDSPNGKRYARRGRSGGIELAYGFDLAPLLARADEFLRLAAEVEEAARSLKLARERITICRRDISKMIAAAQRELMDESPDEGQIWLDLQTLYRNLIETMPRRGTLEQLETLADQLSTLADDILNRLELQVKTAKLSTIESSNERHIQKSDPESLLDSVPVTQAEHAAKPAPASRTALIQGSYTLGMVLRACPDILDYTRNGIGNWRDFLGATSLARSILRISPSAWEEAQTVMGETQAAVAVACIVQRAANINSAGGYLRSLTRKAEAGQLSLGPILMAQIHAREPQL